MAVRTWGKALLGALGLSMLVGAGQLGMAYGFGIVRITGDFTDATVNRWPAQLVWVGWFAASAAVAGAVVSAQLARAAGAATTTGRLRLAGAAALGAMVVAPLCMQPARSTQLNGVDPVWAVGICAILGAVVGGGAALAVLLRPPLGWNVTMTVGAVWLIALVSSLPALVGTGPLPTVRLGVFEPDWLAAGPAQRLAPLLLPLVALLLGVTSGLLARRRGHSPLIGGLSGAAGPVLVAFSYLAAGPGGSADRYQLAPYYGALIAVVTGVLGATAAALLRWPLVPRSEAVDHRAAPSVAPAEGAGPSAIEPTDILRPLATAPSAPAARATDGDPEAAARRVPSTVGDPLRYDSAGITRDRTTPTEGSPAGGGSAGGTPAHWEWPPSAGSAGEAAGRVGEEAESVGEAAGTAGAAALPAQTDTARTDTARTDTTRTDTARTDTTRTDTAQADTPAAGGAAATPDAPAAPVPQPVGEDAPPVPAALDDPAPVRPTSPALDADAATTPTAATTAPTPVPTPPTPAAPTPTTLPTPPATGSVDADATGLVTAGRPKRTRKPKESTATATVTPAAADPGAPTTASAAATKATDAPVAATEATDAPVAATKATDAPVAGSDVDPVDPAPLTPTAQVAPPARPEPAAAADSAGTTVTGLAGSTGPAAGDGADAGARAGTDGASAIDDLAGEQRGAGTPATGVRPDPPTVEPAGSATPPVVQPRRRPRPVFFFEAPAVDDVVPPAPPEAAWTVDSDRDWSAPTALEGGPAPVDPAPRPRPRLPLPDLDRAANWDAFGTATRRARPPAADREPAAGQAPPPALGSQRDGAQPSIPAPARPGRADDDLTGYAKSTGDPTGHGQVDGGAPEGGTAPEAPQPPGDAAEEPAGGRSRLRRALFRRGRTRGDDDADPTSERDDRREQEPLPAQEEEYVDWVTGLARPVPDLEGRPDASGERPQRPSGRHHRD
ncbi:hypothetical protein [Micromonospora sp. DT233]|uniref:hypothetical protein n=1 Tax=Micromonospora sp. DT233 TaxID=3393432 RepID=UPI003CED0AD1